LCLPVVWNSNGYESVESLKLLEGLVDVYLPDLKYSDDALAFECSGVKDYWDTAREAVLEMLRQVGTPVFDGHGLIMQGLIVRHLVLPGYMENSKDVLDWIRISLPKAIYISLMAQYFPCHKSVGHPTLGRRLTPEEYKEILNYLEVIGIENGWVQELDSASEEYVPLFDLTGL
jgi:putative pyruvate formate lyase activating enzyme